MELGRGLASRLLYLLLALDGVAVLKDRSSQDWVGVGAYPAQTRPDLWHLRQLGLSSSHLIRLCLNSI